MRALTCAALTTGVLVLAGCGGGEQQAPAATAGPSVPVLMPGAPGEPAQTATPGQELPAPETGPLGGDLEFVNGMIPHHRQALEMAALAPERASDEKVKSIAERIALGQEPEIAVMSQWLDNWGESVPLVRGNDHAEHDSGLMPGMATAEQVQQLEGTTGEEFDRMFLTLMIAHHEGALTMVDAAAQEGTSVLVEEMVAEVGVTQTKEIEQMRGLLG